MLAVFLIFLVPSVYSIGYPPPCGTEPGIFIVDSDEGPKCIACDGRESISEDPFPHRSDGACLDTVSPYVCLDANTYDPDCSPLLYTKEKDPFFPKMGGGSISYNFCTDGENNDASTTDTVQDYKDSDCNYEARLQTPTQDPPSVNEGTSVTINCPFIPPVNFNTLPAASIPDVAVGGGGIQTCTGPTWSGNTASFTCTAIGTQIWCQGNGDTKFGTLNINLQTCAQKGGTLTRPAGYTCGTVSASDGTCYVNCQQDLRDPDGDGLTTFEEETSGSDGFITNPNNPDSDGDGVSDGPIAPPGCGCTPGPDPNPIQANEICGNSIDDNGNGECEYDSSICSHGDSACPISITAIEAPPTADDSQAITVKCISSIANMNSISATIGGRSCTYQSWESNKAVFSCTTTSSCPTSETIRCFVDTSKSYAAAPTEKTASVSVSCSTCSTYSTSTSCDGDARCDWCLENGPRNKWRGTAGNVCVNSGTCQQPTPPPGTPVNPNSPYICFKGKNNAQCDNTNGGWNNYVCDNYCSGNTLYTRSDVFNSCNDRVNTDDCTATNNQCLTGTAQSCGTTSCDATKHLVGSCNNPCNSAGTPTDGTDATCGTCTPSCSCLSEYYDINNNMADGCEYACTISNNGVEICDGIDNNCNGQIDDNLTPPNADNQNGICSGSKKLCSGTGGWVNPDYTKISGYENPEASCNDGLDNDCDAQWDYDTLDRGPAGNVPPKGDDSCAVGVTAISVSPTNVPQGNTFETTCTSTVPKINSIDAFVANQKCNYIENSWNLNNVRFLCSTSTLSLGSQTAKCAIDTAKSHKSGTDKTTAVNIIQSTCSGYTTSTSCNADPAGRCGWCNECSGNQWSGGIGRCLDINTCSYQLTANKCGAVCDATVGCTGTTDCDTLDKCYQGTYRDYQDLNQWCDLNDGQCKQSLCSVYTNVITDNDGDGYDTQCDNDCNDNNFNINPSKTEICNGVDDDCDAQIDEGLTFVNYYLDSDGDGFGSGTAVNACVSPGANYVTKSGDCNDNNFNINPSATEICDGVDNDCNPATADGSGETAPNNDKQLGICAGTKKTCSGASGWQNSYPAEYESGSELTCSDNKDNDCNGVKDCADTACAKKTGPNGLTCCQTREADCPADGAEGFTGCVNDNTRQGSIGSFACEQNECKPSIVSTTSSCTTNCCLPGGGTATCINSGGTSVIDVDNDLLTEVCSSGNWVGANCQGAGCSDDGTAPHPNYNCAANADCQGDLGQCGEEVCLTNVCTEREKTNKVEICNNAMPTTYECARFFSCSASTSYNCQYGGNAQLCGDTKNPQLGFNAGCSGPSSYLCNVNICISEAVTSNPCCLCYSQCLVAANDPTVAPDSVSECNIAKNFQWTNAQCPFSGGS